MPPQIGKATPPTARQLANPTPKERFQQSAARLGAHRALVDSEAFQVGIDHALLEFQHLVAGRVTDANSAAAAGMKIQGVKEFVDIFRMLSETFALPAPARSGNLHQI
jgi:hypothetical protein